MRRATVLALFVFFFLCLVANGRAWAQQGFGSINGTVRDPKDAVVAKAQVTIISLDSGSKRSITSNDQGLYEVTDLIPGNYTVEVSKQGFSREVISGATVLADGTATVDAKLQVGSVNVSVTVRAQGQLVDKATPAVSVTIGKDLLENLPYGERSSLGAIMLAPEVVGNPEDPEGVDSENPGIGLGTVAPGASIGVGGATIGRTSILVDGSDVTQASFPRVGVSVSGDVVAESTIFVAGTPAQYGRSMGGVVSQSTRSGTSKYHGGVTWRYADSFLEANTWGSTFPTQIHNNLLGFYFGGPVRIPKLYAGRERTFFFASFEPARLKNYASYYGTVPTDAENNGQFADSLSFLNSTILSTQGLAAALAAPRTGHLYYQFALNAQGFPIGPRLGTSQFKQVPNDDLSKQAALNPASQFIRAHYPSVASPGPLMHYVRPDGLWNNQGQNVQFERASFNVDNRYSFRVDHNISERDHVFVRYTNQPLTQARIFALLPDNPIQSSPSDNAHSFDWAANETHVFTSSLVNTLKIMYMQNRQERVPAPPDLATNYGSQLFNLPTTGTGVGMPAAALGYSLGLGYNGYNTQVDQNYQIGDDVTWTRGRHVIGMGIDLRLLRSKQVDLSGNYGGTVTFTGLTNNGSVGGNNYAQLDLGLISSYAATDYAVPMYYFWHYYGGYVQDSFRVKPKMTLSFGLRYEVETPRMEKFDHQGTFLSSYAASLLGRSVTGAFCFSGKCGLSRSLWPTNYHGLEPRVGLIFAPQENLTFQFGAGMLKSPLSGYGNLPSPNYNTSINQIGATTNAAVTDFITNPITTVQGASNFLLQTPSPYAYAPSNLGIAYIDQSISVPYSISWNVAMQLQVDSGTVIKMGYTGLRGVHTISNYAPAQNIGPLSSYQALIASGANLTNTVNNKMGITANYPAPGGAVLLENQVQLQAPYQNFFNSAIQEQFNRKGLMLYNGGYVSVTHVMGAGLSAQGSYTWAKNMDNVGADSVASGLSGAGGATRQNPYSQTGDWSLSTTDIPSRLAVGFTEAIPVGRNQLLPVQSRLADMVLGGWFFGSVISAQSGWPSSIALGGTGWWNSLVPKSGGGYTNNGSAIPTGANLRPDVVPGTSCMSGLNWKATPLTTPYLNQAHFSMPGRLGAPDFGNAPRTLGECRSPHLFQMNANAGKRINLGDGRTLSFGITATNVLNHPTYFSTGNNHNVFSALSSSWLASPNNLPAGGATSAFPYAAAFGLNSTGNIQVRVVQLNARFTF